MGYYTNYSLEVKNFGNTDYDMRVMTDGDGDDQTFVEIYLNSRYLFEDDIKWYNHQDDMRKISKDFKNVLFILSGKGEETEDVWKAYFLDGKMQYAPAKITFDDFDPAKLL